MADNKEVPAAIVEAIDYIRDAYSVEFGGGVHSVGVAPIVDIVSAINDISKGDNYDALKATGGSLAEILAALLVVAFLGEGLVGITVAAILSSMASDG